MTSADPFTAALTKAAPDLIAYLARRVGADDAADLLGETMVAAWRRSADLPTEQQAARMWLFGIARGTLRNHARGIRRRSALANKIRDELQRLTPVAADSGVEVRDAITRLDPDLAEIVRLVHWEHFTLAEASSILGIPASTARGRYQRARARLRIALTEP